MPRLYCTTTSCATLAHEEEAEAEAEAETEADALHWFTRHEHTSLAMTGIAEQTRAGGWRAIASVRALVHSKSLASSNANRKTRTNSMPIRRRRRRRCCLRQGACQCHASNNLHTDHWTAHIKCSAGPAPARPDALHSRAARELAEASSLYVYLTSTSTWQEMVGVHVTARACSAMNIGVALSD